MKPILINKKVAKTTFQIDNCGNTDNITIELTRVGGDGTAKRESLDDERGNLTLALNQ